MSSTNNAITTTTGVILPYKAVIAIKHEPEDFRYRVWVGIDTGELCSEAEGEKYINKLHSGEI